MTTKSKAPGMTVDDLKTAPWLKDFKPLPSNPAELTIEHLKTAFAGDWGALKEVKRIAQETQRKKQSA